MSPFTIALVVFAGLSSAHAETWPSLAELKQTVSLTDLALAKAVEEYESFGFYNISQRAQLSVPYFKEKVAKFMEIPANLTVDDLNDDQYNTYVSMFWYSKYNLINSNAGRITDMLKMNALFNAVLLNNSDSNYHRKCVLSLTPSEIVERVLKVVQEEKSALVYERFVKPNSQLDYLYGELIQINKNCPDILHYQFTAEELFEKCALPSAGCGDKLWGAIHVRWVLGKKAENCLPIDSELRVHKLVAYLTASRNADIAMNDALDEAHLECLLFLKGCQ